MAFFGFAFFVILAVTFPHATLVRNALHRATADSAMRIGFQDIQLRPLLGYTADQVRIDTVAGSPPTFLIDRLDVSPAWRTLLPGRRPSLDLILDLWDGRIESRIGSNRSGFEITAIGNALDLHQATETILLPPGKAYGRTDFELVLSGNAKGRSLTGELLWTARDVALRELQAAGFKVPDLTFETLEVQVAVVDDVVQIQKLIASGNEISIRATGTIHLKKRIERSPLDIRFELQITESAQAGLRLLPRLLPKSDPGSPFHQLKGTLGNPSIG